jgi:hypothetical protein
MPLRYAGIRAPGPGSLVDHQPPLGNGCVGCWWPNAAVDAGRGLWVPDLSGHGQHAQFAGSLPTWAASRSNAWGVNISSDAARWLKVPAGPASNMGTGDFSILLGLTTEATIGEWPNALDCRTKGKATYGWSYCLSGEGLGAFIDFCDADRLYFTLSNDGTMAYAAGAWNVLAVTLDRDGYARSYKQGVQHGTADISSAAAQVATPASGGYLRIGVDRDETTNWRLVGVYEFIAVWDYVLPPEYVAWLTREPAAMIWEPGRKRTFLFGTVAGLTAELSDTGTGADSIAALLACTAALADDGTGADSLDAKAAFAAALVDTAAGTDDLSATAAYLVSVADNAAGAESREALYAATVLLAEDGTGADSLDALKTLLVELSDAAGGSDALAATFAAVVALGDTATGTDTLGAVAAYLADLADGAEGSDALSFLSEIAGLRHVLTIRDKRKVTTIQDLREALTIRDKRDVTTLK